MSRKRFGVCSMTIGVLSLLLGTPGSHAASSKACATGLSTCGDEGCSKAGLNEDHKLLNRTKRDDSPSGTAVDLTIDDFKQLQKQAKKLVGEGSDLTSQQRASLKSLTIGVKSVGEGHRVRIEGYVVGKIRPNRGESVNCYLSGQKNNDIHITIAQDPNDVECKGIVVEMTPQSAERKSGGWSKAKLEAVRDGDLHVLVEGQLLYDNIHKVNTNCSHPLKGQPKRLALWEVHPVAKFLVCDSGEQDCDVNNLGEWTALEDLEE